MKKTGKIILSLSLSLLFVVVCFLIFAIYSVGIWLHTYNVFTKKDLVAEIKVSKIMTEGEYEYSEIEYKPIKQESALISVLTSRKNSQNEYDQVQKYKVYGDHFEIGGEIVKFNDFWLLFNLDTVYKVTRLEGDYIDPEKSKNVDADHRSVFAINGGTDDYWKTLQKNQSKYSFFVDSVYGSFSTKYIQNEEKTFGLYITEDGFMLDELK